MDSIFYELSGLLGIPIGTALVIVKAVNAGLTVAAVVNLAMTVLGGAGMFTASLVWGIKNQITKKGIFKAGLW